MIILFILFIPCLDEIFHLSDTYMKHSSTEKRALSKRPDFNINFLDGFPKAYENYYNDHFMCRDFFIEQYNALRVNYFHQSPIPDKAYIGKHNWLYLQDYTEEYKKQPFSEKQMKQITDELKRRQDFLKQQNCSLYVYIVPTKLKVYPEYAGWMAPYEPNHGMQLETYIRENSDLKCSYLLPVLLKEKSPANPFLFLTSDNHWSDHAGFKASRKIIEDIRRDFPELTPLSEDSVTANQSITKGGNIAEMMGVPFYFMESRCFVKVITPHAKKEEQKEYSAPSDFEGDYELQFNTEEKKLPSALFIRDSFCGAMIPFLSESFSHTTFIFDKWNYGLNESIIKNEKPQLVIYVIYEPLLFNLLD